MTLRHWDSLLSRSVAGSLDLSNGITFGASDDFTIDQEPAAVGNAPADANLKGQAAPAGSAADGGAIRIAGGDRGDASHLAGEVIVELGPADASDATAALSLQTLGASVMRLLLHSGIAAIRAADALAMRLYSDTSIMLDAGARSVQLTSSGDLVVLFTERVIVSSGQVQMVPASTTPATGTLNIDFNVRAKRTYTLGGNVTFAAPTNVLEGATYTIKIKQDLVGNRTATWNAAYKFGALSSTLSTAASAIDVFVFEGSDDGTLHCLIAVKGVQA